jgi:hypothetical protein
MSVANISIAQSKSSYELFYDEVAITTQEAKKPHKCL